MAPIAEKCVPIVSTRNGCGWSVVERGANELDKRLPRGFPSRTKSVSTDPGRSRVRHEKTGSILLGLLVRPRGRVRRPTKSALSTRRTIRMSTNANAAIAPTRTNAARSMLKLFNNESRKWSKSEKARSGPTLVSTRSMYEVRLSVGAVTRKIQHI